MRATKPSRPDWADELEELRLQLGLSQAALARKLKVSAMAPSRWERGVNQPPAEVFVELGKLAGTKKCWNFWGRAGLRKSDVTAVMQKANKSKDHRGKIGIDGSATARRFITPQSAATLIALPLYKTTPPEGVVGPPTIHREGCELVAALRSWCPHPDQTFCLRYTADKMMPLIQKNAIIGVDEAENNAAKLEGKIVLASHAACGLTVHWLQRYGKSEVLVPENKDYPPTYIQNSDWKIIGRVLWWFTQAA
jgi:transcriptional regulator with XRE-family HTH domain